MNLLDAALVVSAFVLGSVPVGVIVARIMGGVDPRSAGSGNIGATNVGRTSGKKAGLVTLAGDILKGALPVTLAFYLHAGTTTIILAGAAAVAGHCFSPFLGFRGGKGVATACGVMAVVSPLSVLGSGAVFAVTVALWRYVSLGSIFAALTMPLFLALIPGSAVYLPLGAFISLLVILKHKDNIKRLMAGKENRL